MHERGDTAEIAGWWRRRRGAKWVVAEAPLPRAGCVKRNAKGLLGSDAERPAYPDSGTGGKFTEEFAAIRIQAETGTHHDILEETGAPSHTDTWFQQPLAPGERGVADAKAGPRFNSAELLVVSRDHQPNVIDRVGRQVKGVILSIEICQPAVLLNQRAVPVPTEASGHGEVGFQFKTVLDEEACFFG